MTFLMATASSLDSPATGTDAVLAMDGGRPCVTQKPDCFDLGPQEIGEEEIAAVTAALRTRNLFRYSRRSDPSPTAQFEQTFAQMTGVEHCLAVNSGTSALIAGLVGLGVSSGDEVIVPAYTYIATAAAVLTVRAIPVLSEIDASLTMDPEDARRKITPRTRAIIPVHMRGTPCRMDELMAIAREHDLKVLEDCAQANGAMYRGRPVGSIGDAGAFSLQQFKIITAGEGGAVTTSDRRIIERAGIYHDAAYRFWKGDAWVTDESFLGENYRMSEMNGALALAQLGKRERILGRLRAIKARMLGALADVPGLKFQDVPDAAGDCAVSLVLFADSAEQAKWFAEALRAEGMLAGSMFDQGFPDRHIYYHWDYVMQKKSPDRHGYPWTDPSRPCHVQYSRDMCPRTLDLLGRAVAIPLVQVMTDQHVSGCIEAIRKVAAAANRRRGGA